MDGVLIDSEQLWDEVREQLARERGGRWHERAQADMMGMSSTEWSRYMHDVIGLAEPPEEINAEVVRRLLARYRESLPLMPGAVEAVERLAARWPLGLASSSNREVIDTVLELAGSRISSARPCPQRKSSTASRHPTSTSRPRDGSASTPRAAPPSRIPRTGFDPHARPACA
jgi:Predicted phosphatase/phosphohexomutase